MGNLLMRRRELILPGGAEETWDYEWVSHDDGYPSDNGWAMSKNGTASVALTDYYTRIRASTSGSYLRYTYPQTYTSGVMEVLAKLGTSGNCNMVFVLGNGTNGIGIRLQYSTNYKGIYLLDDTAIASMTKLQTSSLDTLYTFRFVLNGGFGDVYIDGVKVASSVDITTLVGADGETRVQGGASGNALVPTYLREIRMKFGRV